MTSLAEIQTLEAAHVLQVYRRLPIALQRGSGVRVTDAAGREYLDLISGIGVASLGHAHPGLAHVLHEQSRELLHSSNLFFHPLQGVLAGRLARLSGLPRAFFCNSGAEAVEACLKFARRYWYTRGETQRTEIIALEHGFHGRTMGALSVTWDEHYRTPFQPLIPGVRFVSPTDAAALMTAASTATGAIIVEPIQGEGGVRPLPVSFVESLRTVCADTGALLIADEVQCGLGRTGRPFYHTALGLQPQLMALGKALGAGVPVGAALVSEEVATAVAFGDHGSTYGGNLLACRAALFFLEQLEGGLTEQVRRTGAHLEQGLRDLAEKHPAIAEVRGAGLMWGLDMRTDAAAIVNAAVQHGLLINRTADTVVRLLPPLTITEPDIDRALAILDQVLTDLTAEVPGR